LRFRRNQKTSGGTASVPPYTGGTKISPPVTASESVKIFP
jgi:hypothetical protein